MILWANSLNNSEIKNLFTSKANENFSTFNSKKDNEKEINLHIIKSKKGHLDIENKIKSKYKDISPENI